jgi:hypothetical protein
MFAIYADQAPWLTRYWGPKPEANAKWYCGKPATLYSHQLVHYDLPRPKQQPALAGMGAFANLHEHEATPSQT